MRSHDRGMSGGGCANSYSRVTAPAWGPPTGDCSIVQPWSVGPQVFPAIRSALQARERLLPYIYNTHRMAFDTGIGLIQVRRDSRGRRAPSFSPASAPSDQ